MKRLVGMPFCESCAAYRVILYPVLHGEGYLVFLPQYTMSEISKDSYTSNAYIDRTGNDQSSLTTMYGRLAIHA